MYPILSKQILSPQIKRVDVKAPEIAGKFQPGQFVVVMPDENAQRLAITTVDADAQQSKISLFIDESNPSLKRLGKMRIGDKLFSIAGPFGEAVVPEKKGVVVCISEGLGVASILPIARALKNAGNRVIGIAAFEQKRRLILETRLRIYCDKVLIATRDGSYERKGSALDVFEEVLKKGPVDCVYADGSLEFLKELCGRTQSISCPTYIQLTRLLTNNIDVFDTTRFLIGGKPYFVSVDGPLVNSERINFHAVQTCVTAFKEFYECPSAIFPHNRRLSGSGIFPKLLSGLTKNNP